MIICFNTFQVRTTQQPCIAPYVSPIEYSPAIVEYCPAHWKFHKNKLALATDLAIRSWFTIMLIAEGNTLFETMRKIVHSSTVSFILLYYRAVVSYHFCAERTSMFVCFRRLHAYSHSVMNTKRSQGHARKNSSPSWVQKPANLFFNRVEWNTNKNEAVSLRGKPFCTTRAT